MEGKDGRIYGAILFLDIVKSSVLWREAPIDMYKKLEYFNERIHKYEENNENVIIVKEMGDSTMMFFKNPIESLNFSLVRQILFSEDPILVKNEKNGFEKEFEISRKFNGCW